MNTDIRLLLSFKGHRKRKRLKALLGNGYLDYLVDLWLSVAADRPDGKLTDWDEIDIALAAGWEKDNPEFFVETMVSCGWIDKNGSNEYKIHDWDEHQGWACGATARSEQAKRAAKIRWDKQNGHADSNADSNAGALPEDRLSNAPSPSPSPSLNNSHQEEDF